MEFHNFRHSEEIELFNTFYKEIFPYFSNNLNELISNVFNDLKEKSKTLEIATPIEKFNFRKRLDEFNRYTNKLINDIKKTTNDFSKNYFSERNYPIKIDIEYKYSEYSSENQELKLPSIKLKINLPDKNNETVSKPHSFFNEAKLTSIALSIRFALLKNRIKTSPLKILVLDDLLISLDMSNRIKILKLIFEEFNDFQIIFMTHDKSFYNEIKRRVLTQDWKFFEIIKKVNNIVEIRNAKNELELAKEYFENNYYELCATELRKFAEKTIRNYISPDNFFNKEFKGLEDLIKEAKNKFDNDSLKKFDKLLKVQFEKNDLKYLKNDLDSVTSLTDNRLRGILKSFQKNLFEFLENQLNSKNNEDRIFSELKNIKDRILNPAAHNSESPIFPEELNEAFEIIENLRNIIIENN